MLVSCKRNEPTSWDSDVLIPIARGRITLQDIAPDSILSYDENCLWHLKINRSLTDFNIDSLVSIPDTIIRKGFVVPITGGPFTIPAGQMIINQAEDNLLNLNNVQLRRVEIESGLLQYSIKSYINGYLNCTYEMPGVTLNANPTVIQTTTQPGSGSAPFIFSGEIDLSNHFIYLTGSTGFMFNRIFTHLSISPAVDAPTPTLVSGNDSIVVELRFINPVVRYAQGYFGQHNYHLERSIDVISDFEYLSESALNLNRAMMKLNIVNSVGTDAQIQFTTLTNNGANFNNVVGLNYAPIFQPMNITRAFDNNGTVVPTSYEFTMNETNSNIVGFIENMPRRIDLVADVTINPLGDVNDGNDFIYTRQALNANIEMDVPLAIGLSNLKLRDTLDITTTSELKADGKLYLYVNNAFPFSAKCNVIIIDASGNYEATLLDDAQIDYGIETTVPGECIPVESVLSIPVNQSIISLLKSDHRIAIELIFDTPDINHPSSLYKSHWMDFKVIADGMVQINYR